MENKRRTDERIWKDDQLKDLEQEARRLLKRIDEAKKRDDFSNKEWAAVKRCTMDLSRLGATIRKGFLLRFKD